MKNKLRQILVLVVFTVSVICRVVAFGDTLSSVSIAPTDDLKGLKISAAMLSDERVSVYICESGTTLGDLSGTNISQKIKYYNTAPASGSGEFIYELELDLSVVTDTYALIITDIKGELIWQSEFSYVNEADRQAAVSNIKDCLTTPEDTAKLVNEFKNGAVVLNLFDKDFNLMSLDDQKAVAKTFGDLATDTSALTAEIAAETFKKAVGINLLAKNTSEAKISTIISDYGRNINIDPIEFNGLPTENKNKIASLFSGSYVGKQTITPENTAQVYADYKNIADICNTEGHANLADKVLSVYASKINPNTGVYNNLTYKEEVFKAMIRSLSYNTYAEVRADFEAKANAQYAKEAGTGSSGIGGGGGGGGGYTSQTQFAAPNIPDKDAIVDHPAVFEDINDALWAKDIILGLKNDGIIASDRFFRPNDNIKREEFTKMLVNISGGVSENAACDFSDVPPREWYYPFVATAVQKGIVYGVDEQSFGTSLNITREQMAAMAYRAIKNAEAVANDAGFSDAEEISEFAREAVNYMKAHDIINGYEDGSFRPKANATRAESAKIISLIRTLLEG